MVKKTLPLRHAFISCELGNSLCIYGGADATTMIPSIVTSVATMHYSETGKRDTDSLTGVLARVSLTIRQISLGEVKDLVDRADNPALNAEYFMFLLAVATGNALPECVLLGSVQMSAVETRST